MKMKTTGMMAAVSLCALAGVAQGQQTLGFDVNDFGYAVSGSWIDPENFTGSINLSFGSASLVSHEVGQTSTARLGYDGEQSSWTNLDIGYELTGFIGEIHLAGGKVDSGYFTMTIGNGDSYTASFSEWVAGGIDPAAGRIVRDGTSGYRLRMESEEGAFADFGTADEKFGDVDVSEWMAYQHLAGHLFGDFIKMSFGAAVQGDADAEIFVMVPLPPAAYAGFGMLAGVMGLSYARRRR